MKDDLEMQEKPIDQVSGTLSARVDSKLNRKYMFWTYNFSTIIFMILYTIHMIIYAAEYDFDLILFSCLLFNIILLSYFTLVAR